MRSLFKPIITAGFLLKFLKYEEIFVYNGKKLFFNLLLGLKAKELSLYCFLLTSKFLDFDVNKVFVFGFLNMKFFVYCTSLLLFYEPIIFKLGKFGFTSISKKNNFIESKLVNSFFDLICKSFFLWLRFISFKFNKKGLFKVSEIYFLNILQNRLYFVNLLINYGMFLFIENYLSINFLENFFFFNFQFFFFNFQFLGKISIFHKNGKLKKKNRFYIMNDAELFFEKFLLINSKNKILKKNQLILFYSNILLGAYILDGFDLLITKYNNYLTIQRGFGKKSGNFLNGHYLGSTSTQIVSQKKLLLFKNFFLIKKKLIKKKLINKNNFVIFDKKQLDGIYIWDGKLLILPFFINKIFFIHNGHGFTKLGILPAMVGHKFGEFSFTRGICYGDNRIGFTFKNILN